MMPATIRSRATRAKRRDTMRSQLVGSTPAPSPGSGRPSPAREQHHGTESGLTGRQLEELSKILGIPSGAFAAPLEAPLIAGLPHEVESEARSPCSGLHAPCGGA